MKQDLTGSCLVILSGGQDSTTALAWAKQRFRDVHAVTFNYGQKHAIEIGSAKKVGEILGVASHEIVDVGPILLSTSPLVNNSTTVGQYASADALPGGIEPTFVPGRNALFLVLAVNRAVAKGINNLVTGVCQADFGGYPDCRQVFIDAMALAMSEAIYGLPHKFLVHTPLMNLTKADSVKMAEELPGAWQALAFSHTCYNGEYPPNPHNHASLLRARGFRDAGRPDPLILRAKGEKKLPADYPDNGLVEGTKYAMGGLPKDQPAEGDRVITDPQYIKDSNVEMEKDQSIT